MPDHNAEKLRQFPLACQENQSWILDLNTKHPGVYLRESTGEAKLLSMNSIATLNRSDELAFQPSNLIQVSQCRGRIEATYDPEGWNGLRIRAAWSRVPVGDGVDLEVQIQASKQETFLRLEVGICTEWGDVRGEVLASQVEPRDPDSAQQTYDGHESPNQLQVLTSLPIPSPSPHRIEPRIFSMAGSNRDIYYVEMVRPNDCSRRLLLNPNGMYSEPGTGMSTRYELFGHDLEKGVVLRGRLRGLWIKSGSPERDAHACYEAFLSEPPPLGP